ncbi:MAG: hypothetical protein AAF211_19220 [Myxococcota bacterium]
MVVWWMMLGSLAMAVETDADTDTDTDSDTDTDTDSDSDADTDDTADVNLVDTACETFDSGEDPCSTAGELAGEKGGSPCDDGCDSSGGALPAIASVALTAWAIRRRQRR